MTLYGTPVLIDFVKNYKTTYIITKILKPRQNRVFILLINKPIVNFTPQSRIKFSSIFTFQLL